MGLHRCRDKAEEEEVGAIPEQQTRQGSDLVEKARPCHPNPTPRRCPVPIGLALGQACSDALQLFHHFPSIWNATARPPWRCVERKRLCSCV